MLVHTMRNRRPPSWPSASIVPFARPLTTAAAQEEHTKDNSFQVTFVTSAGERLTARANEGDSLLDVVVNNDVALDGFGACEGTLACSTCHVILSEEDFARLPNKPVDEELDMLDLAVDLCDTSRLGCQVVLCKAMPRTLEVTVPSGTRDARAL